MSVNYYLLGRRIRETRIALRITQSELAEMTDLSEHWLKKKSEEILGPDYESKFSPKPPFDD